ncbi:MAG: PH domain-containing protein [Planctomycetota bacterium]
MSGRSGGGAGGRASGPKPRSSVEGLVPSGERVVLRIKPSLLSIPLRALPVLTAAVVAVGIGVFGLPAIGVESPVPVGLYSVVAAVVALIWQTIAWTQRTYALTERRIAAAVGVFNRAGLGLPLDRVQHVVLTRSLLERFAGVGTLGVASAGTGSVELRWIMIDRPKETAARVRAAVDAVRAAGAGVNA